MYGGRGGGVSEKTEINLCERDSSQNSPFSSLCTLKVVADARRVAADRTSRTAKKRRTVSAVVLVLVSIAGAVSTLFQRRKRCVSFSDAFDATRPTTFAGGKSFFFSRGRNQTIIPGKWRFVRFVRFALFSRLSVILSQHRFQTKTNKTLAHRCRQNERFRMKPTSLSRCFDPCCRVRTLF